MRRLIDRFRDEHGASAVLVAILMLALVGSAAIAVDVGAMYSERAQLQNSADAGAIAAAQYCGAHGGCAAQADKDAARAAALGVTGGNTVDGDATVLPLTFTSDTVRVFAQTPNMAHPFAAAFGLGTTDVGADAIAKWVVGATYAGVVPFAIGECSTTSTAIEFIEIENDPCPGSIPGGFGWLENPTNSCIQQVAIGGFTDITTGNVGKCAITAAELSAMATRIGCDLAAAPMNTTTDRTTQFFYCLIGRIALVPVYERADSCPGLPDGKEYCITKFAAYEMSGFHLKFNGGTQIEYCAISNCNFPTNWGVLGFTGRFVEYVTAEDAWTLGPAGAAGTPSIRLVQ